MLLQTFYYAPHRFLIAAVAAAGIIYLTFYLSISIALLETIYAGGILGTLCFAAALFPRPQQRLRASEV